MIRPRAARHLRGPTIGACALCGEITPSDRCLQPAAPQNQEVMVATAMRLVRLPDPGCSIEDMTSSRMPDVSGRALRPGQEAPCQLRNAGPSENIARQPAKNARGPQQKRPRHKRRSAETDRSIGWFTFRPAGTNWHFLRVPLPAGPWPWRLRGSPARRFRTRSSTSFAKPPRKMCESVRDFDSNRRLQRLLVLFARADTHNLGDGVDEYLSVADFASARRFDDHRDGLFGIR